MEVLKIPTARDGVFLRSVTELEDKAWMLTNRRFKHPLSPDKVGSPDHNTYKQLRALRKNPDPNTLNMGIWDVKAFQNIAFIGYVSLKPVEYEVPACEIGVVIAQQYRRRGYARLAIQSITNHGRDQLGYEVATADILSGNVASRQLFEDLGYEESGESRGHIQYAKPLVTHGPIQDLNPGSV